MGMNFESFIRSILVVFLLSLLSACGPQIQTTVNSGGPSVQEAVTYQGPRARIAVAKFRCKAAKCYGSIGEGFTDMLGTALFRTGKYVVLERGEGLAEIQQELNLGESRYVKKSQAPKVGQMEGADILIMGAITAFEPHASGSAGGGVVIPLGVPFLGGAGLKKKEAFISADIRLVDVRSGRVVNATSVDGLASSYKVGGLGGFRAGNVILGGGFSTYKNTPMEKAVRVMLDSAINEIAKRTPENYFRYDESGNAYPPKGGTSK